MTRKQLLALAVAAVAGLLLALWINHASRPQGDVDQHAQPRLVPGLREHVDALHEIRIIGAGNERVVTLRRGDAGWQVADRDGWPADRSRLRALLVALADAALAQPRTSQPQRYAELGVEDVGSAAASGVAIELHGDGEPVKIVIGHLDARQQGTFVRRAHEPQSWLATTAITVPRQLSDWLDDETVSLDAGRIAAAHIQQADSHVHLHRDAPAGPLLVDDVPADRAPAAAHVLQSVAAALPNMRVQDVEPRHEPPAAPAFQAQFTTFDGLVVSVLGWRDDGQALVNVSAAVQDMPAGDDPGERDAAAAMQSAGREVSDDVDAGADGLSARQHAERINARLGNRTLIIATHQFDAFDKSMDDLTVAQE